MRRKFAITHAPTDPRSGFDDNPVGESRIVEWGRPKSRPPFPATERVTLTSRKPLAQHSGPPRRRTWCRPPQRSYTPGEGRAPYGCAAKRSAASLSAAAQPAESVGRLLLAARVALALACLRAFLALMMSFRACCAGRVAAWSMRLTARSSNVVTRAGMASPAHAALVGVGFTGQPLLVHGGVVPVVGGPGVAVIVLTRTKRSGQEPGVMNEPHTFVSSGTRLVAVLTKATTLPSAEIAGKSLLSFAWAPAESTLTSSVVAVSRSWTNTSATPLVSPGTRLVASLSKATNRPSLERAGQNCSMLAAFACAPVESTLTRSVIPVIRSLTKTSKAWFVSPTTKSSASLAKATKRPSAETTGLKLRPLPCAPEELTLTRCVFAVHPATDTPFVRQRSRTKTSVWSFVSPGTRLVASLEKATKRPSAETAGAKNPAKLSSFACAPVEDTLTRFVVPVIRSWTKTSTAPLVSRPTRLVASLENATKRPAAEMAGVKLVPFASAPAEEMLTRPVVPVSRSRTNTSVTPLVSPGTRLVASLGNATKRPSAEMAGAKLVPFASAPAEETLTRSVVPVTRS